jgi:hypothetical protein
MIFEYLTEEQEYVKAVNTKQENYSTESLFMALIFQQQKTDSELIAKLSL